MKTSDITDKYLYHVTYTKNVPSIQSKGLIQFQPSNWVRGASDTRYNDEAGVFAFTDAEDAVKWALKMKFDLPDKDISIIRLDMADYWEDDPSQDPMLALTSKGKALRSRRNVSADKIIDSFKLDDFGSPMESGMPQREWFAHTANELSK